ncbi:MAG: HYExAFE family protein [Planctomycetaceae bacterium]|nr:HYExAFE family protein [Planctomycetaceae bacterium]
MIRTNHYEAAFEEYLRIQRTAYVAVDESRRALLKDASLKSMDFIVYCESSTNLLVDIKGRKRLAGRSWENWATVEDIHGLTQWQKVFGNDFRSLLVFAYELIGDFSGEPSDSVVSYQSKRYAFYGVWLDEYRKMMKQRSPSWQTVWVPTQQYQQLRFPLGKLFPQESSLTAI